LFRPLLALFCLCLANWIFHFRRNEAEKILFVALSCQPETGVERGICCSSAGPLREAGRLGAFSRQFLDVLHTEVCGFGGGLSVQGQGSVVGP